jgi:DNA-binding CsgD family transcriptional regulator
MGVDLAAVLHTVGALRQACHGEDFVLLGAGVVDGMRRVFAADEISLNDRPANAQCFSTLSLWPVQAAGTPQDPGRRELPEPPGDPGHALVMPLPAPLGIARRLVFTRCRPFGAEDRSAAVLLQPHIADALRSQSRRDAERLLTGRQRELLRLVAAGHDNTAIARQLGLSPGTVRKHLENAFARLDVSTRTAAVAKVCPDAVWSDPVRENDEADQVVMSG